MSAVVFTDAQRASIRWYLGWSARFHQSDSGLEQAMSAIDQETDGATNPLIVAQLTALDGIRDAIAAAYTRLKALEVGSIKLSGPGEIGMLRSEGRRLSGALAATLDVPTRHDVWSGMGNKSSYGPNGSGGGGNTYRHG